MESGWANRRAALARMNLALRRMRSAEDEAISLRSELTDAKDDVAAGRAGEVIVIAYGGRSVPPWWDRQRAGLERIASLRVLEINQEQSKALAALCARSMRLHCTIQDGQALLGDASQTVLITPITRLPH